jgi:8-oxo-dGTP diphosphatase
MWSGARAVAWRWRPVHGGMLEAKEDPGQAIQREIKEELDVEVIPGRKLSTVTWEYPGKKIGLIPIICELRFNQISLREHQQYAWYSLPEIEKLDLLEADRAILTQLD